MTYDPSNTADGVGNNPNKGLNTRTFLLSVLAALVVLLLIAVAFARHSSVAATPGKNTSPPSSSPAPETPTH